MRSSINILIVDDQHLVRLSVRKILKDNPSVNSVSEASSGSEALKLAKETKFDIALIDLKMPVMDGLETSKKLLKITPSIKIIVVTACIDELLLPKLFKAGISGYFSKSNNPLEIMEAIRIIQSGQKYVSKLIPNQTQRASDSPNTELAIFDTLSERELQTILMIIKGLNPAKISQKLEVDIKTVNSYRARSFLKLGIKNDVELGLLATRRKLMRNKLL